MHFLTAFLPFVTVSLIIAFFVIFPLWRLLKKAGIKPAWSLTVLPFWPLTAFWLWVLAYKKWPSEEAIAGVFE